jgi:hypothetical protein
MTPAQPARPRMAEHSTRYSTEFLFFNGEIVNILIKK